MIFSMLFILCCLCLNESMVLQDRICSASPKTCMTTKSSINLCLGFSGIHGWHLGFASWRLLSVVYQPLLLEITWKLMSLAVLDAAKHVDSHFPHLRSVQMVSDWRDCHLRQATKMDRACAILPEGVEVRNSWFDGEFLRNLVAKVAKGQGEVRG
ncbi:hypothetical protein BKA81DRAFT_359926 [Phyllosticta paracitricarpa]|uniref:Uncharacterized protein n=2 Tax=Phyllosticta TaxID=121621 RepID=A0ABR1M3W7_9PEZI